MHWAAAAASCPQNEPSRHTKATTTTTTSRTSNTTHTDLSGSRWSIVSRGGDIFISFILLMLASTSAAAVVVAAYIIDRSLALRWFAIYFSLNCNNKINMLYCCCCGCCTYNIVHAQLNNMAIIWLKQTINEEIKGAIDANKYEHENYINLLVDRRDIDRTRVIAGALKVSGLFTF